MNNISVDEIEAAKTRTKYSLPPHHESDDLIRIAYEWLDAQKRLKRPTTASFPIKHIIERWAGVYVSQTDVEVAAELHQEIIGKYPHFNIGAKLVRPNKRRLVGILDAGTQGYEEISNPYKRVEE